MIGLYRRWDGAALDPDLVRRFSGSLGAGIAAPVGHQVDRGALFAALCASPVASRGWRAAQTPRGERVLFAGHLDQADALAAMSGERASDAASLYAAGYARWGEAVDRHLVGHYAAIVVSLEDKWVRCARSPLHAPPLHIWHDRTRIIVASIPRALFATGEVTAEIDEQKIADSLYLNYAEGERGWFKDVRRVATGSQVVLTPDRITTRHYYDVADLPQVSLRRDADYVEAATALLREGTRAALAGFERPAVSLSGGLDSQAVASFAIDCRGPGRSLLGLTGVPEPEWPGDRSANRFDDERHHVASLAEMYPDLSVETVDAAGLSFDHMLPAMFMMAGAPPRNAMNLHWIHALRARAKALGCDVLLLGQLGNLGFSFSGAGAMPAWLVKGRWPRLLREAHATRKHRRLPGAVLEQAVAPHLPDWVFRLRHRQPAAAVRLPDWCPIRDGYAQRMQVAQRARDMGHDPGFRPPRSTRAARLAMLGGAANEVGDVRQALDWIHGVPSRDPTAYRPLVEFCLGIPDDQYLRDGKTRWLARRMLRGRVPDRVVDETRRGRQAADWPLRLARQRDALIGELDRLAADPAMSDRLDIPRLKEAVERWPKDEAPCGAQAALIELALPRAIATARFIRYVEGSNRA